MYKFSFKIFIVCCLCCIQYGFGQDKNELSVYGMGIFSSLDYKLNKGNHTKETGGGVGISYSYVLNKHWSIGVGGEFQSYQGRAFYRNLHDSYEAIDIEGDSFIFNYQAENYIERQYASFINIPLAIRYETQGITGFYAMGGIKVGFPISAEYEVEMKSLRTSGYYSQWDAELEEPMFMGYGYHKDIRESKKDLDLKNSYNLLLEAGVKQQLGKNDKVYIGLFFEYGLNTLQEEDTPHRLVEYNTDRPATFNYHSVFTSHSAKTGSGYTKDVRVIGFGVKLRYAFFWKSKK